VYQVWNIGHLELSKEYLVREGRQRQESRSSHLNTSYPKIEKSQALVLTKPAMMNSLTQLKDLERTEEGPLLVQGMAGVLYYAAIEM